MGEIVKDGPWLGFEVISSYTRKQAIEDGVLVDLSTNFPADTRMFKWNVCCTSAVWALIDSAAAADEVEAAVYVWDVCYMACAMIQSVKDAGSDTMYFRVCMPLREAGTEKKLKLVCGPGDGGEPVLTIMMPEED